MGSKDCKWSSLKSPGTKNFCLIQFRMKVTFPFSPMRCQPFDGESARFIEICSNSCADQILSLNIYKCEKIFMVIQGTSKRLFPGCETRWKICVFQPAESKQNTTFSPDFTQPGKNLLEISCKCHRHGLRGRCQHFYFQLQFWILKYSGYLNFFCLLMAQKNPFRERLG